MLTNKVEKESELNKDIKKYKWAAGALFCILLFINAGNAHAIMNGSVSHWLSNIALTGPLPDCGDKIEPLEKYDRISTISLALGFALFLAGTFIEKSKIKKSCFLLTVFPLCAWIYVQFFIDYEKIRENLFAYDTAAESALANIAEAQDRYKSERGNFIKNLQKIHSHTAGAHGLDACIRITKITATYNHWSAQAKHVSSPNTITWDSDSGSSLKKG